MIRAVIILIVAFASAGCGVESLTSAAVSGTEKAEEAKQAQETVKDVESQLDQALEQGRQRLEESAGKSGE